MDYKTVEGHEIKVGECYQTRDGRKAFVTHCDKSFIYGAVINDTIHMWGMTGESRYEHESDLMRPWPTNRLEVTDEMVKIAMGLYHPSAKHYQWHNDMKAALEAVFDMVGKDAVSANNAQSKDNDGWIEWQGGECPVPPLTEVDIICGNRALNHSGFPADAFFWNWRNNGEYSDIIAYRIIKEPEKKYYGHIDKNGNYTFPHETPQEVSRCERPAHCWGGLSGLCGVCHKVISEKDKSCKGCDTNLSKDFCQCTSTASILPEKEKIPTLMQYWLNEDEHGDKDFEEVLSEYLDKYMSTKDAV